jgi:hypothetical protein
MVHCFCVVTWHERSGVACGTAACRGVWRCTGSNGCWFVILAARLKISWVENTGVRVAVWLKTDTESFDLSGLRLYPVLCDYTFLVLDTQTDRHTNSLSGPDPEGTAHSSQHIRPFINLQHIVAIVFRGTLIQSSCLASRHAYAVIPPERWHCNIKSQALLPTAMRAAQENALHTKRAQPWTSNRCISCAGKASTGQHNSTSAHKQAPVSIFINH